MGHLIQSAAAVDRLTEDLVVGYVFGYSLQKGQGLTEMNLETQQQQCMRVKEQPMETKQIIIEAMNPIQ